MQPKPALESWTSVTVSDCGLFEATELASHDRGTVLGIDGPVLWALVKRGCWGGATRGHWEVFTGIGFAHNFGLYHIDTLTLVIALVFIKTATSLWGFEEMRSTTPILV